MMQAYRSKGNGLTANVPFALWKTNNGIIHLTTHSPLRTRMAVRPGERLYEPLDKLIKATLSQSQRA